MRARRRGNKKITRCTQQFRVMRRCLMQEGPGGLKQTCCNCRVLPHTPLSSGRVEFCTWGNYWTEHCAPRTGDNTCEMCADTREGAETAVPIAAYVGRWYICGGKDRECRDHHNTKNGQGEPKRVGGKRGTRWLLQPLPNPQVANAHTYRICPDFTFS